MTFRQHEVDEAWAVLRSPADRARYDEELRSTRAVPSGPTTPTVPLRRGTSPAGAGHDEVPLLEVIDVLDAPVPAADGRPDRSPRGRRWRFLGSFLAVVLGALAIGVTGGWGGREVGAETSVRTVAEPPAAPPAIGATP